jgi:hypothetical protein
MIIKLILKIINFNLIYFFCKNYIKIKWNSKKKLRITLNATINEFHKSKRVCNKVENINEIIFKII